MVTRLLPKYICLAAVVAWVFRLHPCEPLYWGTHAALHEPQRAAAVLEAWRAGIVDARWLPNMDSGHGLPVLAFYAPLFSWISAVLLKVTGDPALAVKINLMLWMGVGLTGVVEAGKLVWRDAGQDERAAEMAGWMAALGWLMTPYGLVNIFVRGALSEFACAQLLPWILAAALGYRSSGKPSWLGVLLAGAGLAVITHNFIGLTVIPGAALLGMVLLPYPGRFWRWQAVVGASVGLTAFFWLPALRESDWVHLQRIRIFVPEEHYLTVRNWFSVNYWGFGFSFPGPGDTMPLHIGYGGLVSLLAAIPAAIVARERRIRRIIGGLLAASLFFFYLTSGWSLWLWNTVPLMAEGQFPWRFLNYVGLFLALLLPAPFMAMQSARFRMSWLWLAGAGLLGLASLKRYGDPAEWYRTGEVLRLEDMAVIRDRAGDHNEYNPIWRPDDRPEELPPGEIEMDGGGVEIKEGNAAMRRLRVDVKEAGEVVRVGWNYYPLWHAWNLATGESLSVEPDARGLIGIGPLAPGSYDIRLEIAATRWERIGRMISLLFLAGLALAARHEWKGRPG